LRHKTSEISNASDPQRRYGNEEHQIFINQFIWYPNRSELPSVISVLLRLTTVTTLCFFCCNPQIISSLK